MKPCCARLALLLCLVGSGLIMTAQTTPAGSNVTPGVAESQASVVPQLVKFAGTLSDLNGKPLTGILGVAFALYKDPQGGAPLWLETQNVQADSSGHYSVMLGSTIAEGLPADVFSSGDARWLGVQPAGQPEQARVMLLSVPYALKAGDAQTLGGLPASAFMLSVPVVASAQTPGPAATTTSNTSPATSSDVTTSGGTVNSLPLFTTATNIQNSIVTQTGAGATGKIGINTAAPGATLDVNGTANIHGSLTLTATGTAAATAGKNSQPQDFIASVFNSTTSTAVSQKFQWQAQPAANDTANASGSLNLLYASGVAAPAQTGLSINSKGVLTFAPGQKFPIPGAGVTNAMLAHPSLTVTAGTALTGGGVVSLGGATTLNVDLTKVPLLAVANTFTGNQAVNGNLAATGVVAASSFEIGSNLFGFGSFAGGTAFTGFAGNVSTLGAANTGDGVLALASNTGTRNTAVGTDALGNNTTGGYNTGLGAFSGYPADGSKVTGEYNTFLGAGTQISTGTLTNATAVGANSQVKESNALVLGSIPGVNGATVSPNVGIGTSTPAARLTISGPESTANGFGAAIKLSNSASGGANYYFRVGATGTETSAGGLSIANDDEYIMTLTTPGYVGIQTQNPTNIFTIVQGGGSAIADGWATYSSRRWKTNIQPLTGALAKVERLRGVSYDLKATGKHEIGVIAEEVGKVVPEVVTYEANGQDARSVDYSRLTALLIEAVKQQEKQISAQTRQIAAQERQIRHEQRLVFAQQHEIARLSHKVSVLQTSMENAAGRSSSFVALSIGTHHTPRSRRVTRRLQVLNASEARRPIRPAATALRGVPSVFH